MSILQYWRKMSIPVVPILDERLNFFQKHGIEMKGILGYEMPWGSFKFLAAASLLEAAHGLGFLSSGTEIIEASSGRTIVAFAKWARPWNVSVVGVMKSDVPRGKMERARVAGVRIMSPLPGLTGVATARQLGGGGWLGAGSGWGKDGNRINIDQYAAPYWHEYRDWGVSSILDADGRLADRKGFDVIVAPIGTGLTLAGLGEGFRQRFGESITIVAARCSHQHEIPGMRDDIGLQDVSQPWNQFQDFVVDVDRRPALLCTPWLDWAGGFDGGLSSGGAYVAACQFARRVLSDEMLEAKVRNPKTGKIKIGIVLHDNIDPYPGDRLVTDYSEDCFHPSTADLPEKIIFG